LFFVLEKFDKVEDFLLLGGGKLADFLDENITERIFCLGLGEGGSNHGFETVKGYPYILLEFI
jgi:hypothetical protein